MSFQLATATALPAEIQLAKEKPQGAFALRTRYALSANSANSWNAGTLVSLPLQTGTPGTFTDVKQGCINCTIQITNTNPYVDFLNFGPCGAMIFFEEMRVYSSGTPVEENLKYSETVDLLMMQAGHQAKPYHIFRRNNWRAAHGAAGDKHINFIKPSMVDTFGVPMFGNTPFMDNNSAVYCPPGISFGIQASSTLATAVVDAGYRTISTPVNGSTGATPAYFGQVWGNDSAAPFNDIGFDPTVTPAALATTAFYDGNATNFGAGPSTIFRYRNPSHVTPGNGANGAIRTSLAASDMLAWKNTQVGRSAPSASQIALAPWLPAANYVPSQWPDFQPATLCGEISDSEVDKLMGKTKMVEYMKYLSNVRSLPIGVRGSVAQGTANGYSSVTAALAPGAEGASMYTEYRVSMPFLSGIYGVLADKMFPDLLIGANNIRIEFKLASNVKAFWTTMDPLRRVPGTVRDFAPFTGSADNSNRVSSLLGGMSMPGANAALGCSFAAVNTSTSAAAVYLGGTGIAVGDGGVIVAGSAMYNTASAMGQDLVPRAPRITRGASSLESTGVYRDVGPFFPTATISSVGGVFTLSGAVTPAFVVGTTIRIITDTTVAEQGLTFQVNTITSATTGTFAPVATDIDAASTFTYVLPVLANYVQYSNENANPLQGQGFHLPIESNLPKPQYVPINNVWANKVAGSSVYINETKSCYGSYLPASVPQSRRCQLSSRLNIGSSSDLMSNGNTIFTIRDIQYIGEQVQLDDISTAAIIQHAATSEIVVWTRGYRTFEASCDNGTQQNIILPIQIGQATALYMVFRPSSVLQSMDYYSNSFVCPFTGLSYTSVPSATNQVGIFGASGPGPDVGGSYTLSSSLNTSALGEFSYQLFSGSKQYPLQPIQTVSEMLVECEKSTHSLHNWAFTCTNNMALNDWGQGISAGGAAAGFDFNPFLDLGFFTTFVPIGALDDQTITQNPYFSIAEVSDVGLPAIGGRVRGVRQPGIIQTATGVGAKFVGCLNHYVSPIATFFLGWDFESWTNHEDLMRTGKFLGQEQLSIRLTGTHLMATTNPIASGSSIASVPLNVGVTAIVPHVVKMSFVPGGHMLTYY